MQGPTRLCEAKYQTAWTIFVVQIVFDDLAICDRFMKFLHTDMAEDALINRMLCEFELILRDLVTDFFNHRRERLYTSFISTTHWTATALND